MFSSSFCFISLSNTENRCALYCFSVTVFFLFDLCLLCRSNNNSKPQNKRRDGPNINGEPKLKAPKNVALYGKWPNVILDGYLRQRLGVVVDVMTYHDDWKLWFAPVDTSLYPDYLRIIKQPMDYATLKHNITVANKYDTLYHVYKEFLLIYYNSYLYNKGQRAQIYDKTILTEILF